MFWLGLYQNTFEPFLSVVIYSVYRLGLLILTISLTPEKALQKLSHLQSLTLSVKCWLYISRNDKKWTFYAWFNSTCYHPPRAYPRGFAIFFSLGGLFPTPGHAERDNSPPPGLLIDHKYVVLRTKCRSRNWFPYNSKTRHFDKNFNAFLEFLEQRTLHV